MQHKSSLTPRDQKMFALIEKYLTSGLTQKIFCQQESVAYSTFQWWLCKYRKSKKSKNIEQNSFIPVQIKSLTPEHSIFPVQHACTIEYPNGVIIKLAGKIDSQLLTNLIQIPTK